VPQIWKDGHVSLGTLWGLYCQYPYMPRLRDRRVLEEGVLDLPMLWETDAFALATDIDATGRYVGLWISGDNNLAPAPADSLLLVRPDVATHQRNHEVPAEPQPGPSPGPGPGPGPAPGPGDRPKSSLGYQGVYLNALVATSGTAANRRPAVSPRRRRSPHPHPHRPDQRLPVRCRWSGVDDADLNKRQRLSILAAVTNADQPGRARSLAFRGTAMPDTVLEPDLAGLRIDDLKVVLVPVLVVDIVRIDGQALVPRRTRHNDRSSQHYRQANNLTMPLTVGAPQIRRKVLTGVALLVHVRLPNSDYMHVSRCCATQHAA
jgi:hypothetical protein